MTQTIHTGFCQSASLPAFSDPIADATSLYVSLSGLIQDQIFFHPKAALESESLSELDRQTLQAMAAMGNPVEYFVDALVNVIKTAVEPQYSTVKVCLSDSDSHVFGALLGGTLEQAEVNPAMGVRGVSRFASDSYSSSFSLECEVIKRLRADGITVEVVVPFVRSLSDAAKIIDRLAEQGLPRGLHGLKVLYVCDVPASALMSEKLLQYFDGLVVNVDHLTQFSLGLDKANEGLINLFDPENEAILHIIATAAKSALAANKPVLVASDDLVSYPKLQDWLIEIGVKDVVVTA
ncbi:phosphoenolpyruvate synthase [Vibrio sp. Of7-15]|uniref:putative PEP-binding protein n=1 Tax=Vibrio sp. Of7-15 TaxID=2724879 RepID=UPI001EF195C2|nr:putative PEP-binding protein [Vibrio sp. Of7-15]MCG7496302.1 phosphoenolpyruvate synthase [Vibrio sp. Of7-15]